MHVRTWRGSHSDSSMFANDGVVSNSGGYSLFDGTGQSLFGSFLFGT